MDGENDKTRRQRLRREDPKRVGPIRNWQTLLRRSDSWNPRDSLASGGDEAAGEERVGSWNETVAHGVKLGYSVIEEQIRQGQRIAQDINERSYAADTMEDNVGKLLERVMRFYTDVSSLCVELVESTLRNSGVSGIYRAPEGFGPAGDPSQHGQRMHASTSVSMEIASSRPTEVKLDLQPNTIGADLAAHELRALDPQVPPITDVSFELDRHSGVPRLRIAVPDGQPPAIYTGAIIDRTTNEPRGTLSIRVDE